MLEIEIKDIKMKFETSSKVFSPLYIDRGTLAMLSKVEFSEKDKVLDLGCGYGVVGIYASKIGLANSVVMSDISNEAIELSSKNIEINEVKNAKLILSNGLEAIEDKDFTIILSNPPYHENFSVPKGFIEKGYDKLVIGGKLFMVTKRKEWYKRKLITIFGGVKIYEINEYFVFEAEKRSPYKKSSKANKVEKKSVSKKIERKMSKKQLGKLK